MFAKDLTDIKEKTSLREVTKYMWTFMVYDVEATSRQTTYCPSACPDHVDSDLHSTTHYHFNPSSKPPLDYLSYSTHIQTID